MRRIWKSNRGSTKAALHRREVLKLGALAVAAGFAPSLLCTTPSYATAHERHPKTSQQQKKLPEKTLWLYNMHTGETFRTVYWAQETYLSDALQAINRVLRDHHTNEIRPIDPQLLDVLHTLAQTLEVRESFHVISGYRSAATNALLRRYNQYVAEPSWHVEGKAVDIYLPGQSTSLIRKAAVALRAGGVGSYPRRRSVHVDTGPVRYW